LSHGQNNSETEIINSVERIGLIVLKKVKHSGGIYYVTIDPTVINRYNLTTGDVLKINLIEAAKVREHAVNHKRGHE